MAEANLNIVLKLIDQASAELKSAMQGVGDETEKTGKKSDEASKKMDNGFKKASQSIRTFRKEMFVVAATIGILSVSIQEYAKYNDTAQKSVDKLSDSFSKLKILAGSVAAPLLNFALKFSPAMMIANALAKGTSPVGQAMEKQTTLTEAANALRDYKKELSEIDMMYSSGQMSAENYYANILMLQNSQIGFNDVLKSQIQEIAALEMQTSNEKIMQAQLAMDEQINLLQYYKEVYTTAHQGMTTLTIKLGQAIQTGLGGAITDVIMGTKKAGEAFKEFGMMLVRTLVDFIVQKLIAAALEKAIMAATVAAGVATGSALAAAYAPAALAANIMSFGGAAAAAAASFPVAAASLATSMGILGSASGMNSGVTGGMIGLSTKHQGGIIRAHNGLAVDEVPIIAQTGEGVLSRRGMAAIGGESALNSLNAGGGAGMAVNIYYPQFTSEDSIKGIVERIGYEIDRQLRYARGA